MQIDERFRAHSFHAKLILITTLIGQTRLGLSGEIRQSANTPENIYAIMVHQEMG